MTENVAAVQAEEAVKAEEAVQAEQAVAEEAPAAAPEAPAAAPEEAAAAPEAPAAELAKETEVNPLERTVDFRVAHTAVQAKSRKKIQEYQKKARIAGFRKGHVPFKMIEEIYGGQAFSESLNELVDTECRAAVIGLGIPVAGTPEVSGGSLDETGEYMLFTATFETYPDIELPDFSTVELKKYECAVDDAAIQKTIDVMVRQRATFVEEVGRACIDGDRVTLDFRGTRNGEPFDGGSAEGFAFQLGQGRMLPEFEAGVSGLAAGGSRTFPLTFPENYGGKDLAGQQVEFTVEVKKVEKPVYPELDDEFAKSLGLESVSQIHDEVGKNLNREVRARVLQRNKTEVLMALSGLCSFPLPKALVNSEAESMLENAKKDMEGRQEDGIIKSLTADMFRSQAEQRVKLGLFIGKIAAEAKISAGEEDVRAIVGEMSEAYQDPEALVRYIMSDSNQYQAVLNIATENKIVEYVLANAKTEVVSLAFEDLMPGQGMPA